jgi:hypothetical protein
MAQRIVARQQEVERYSSATKLLLRRMYVDYRCQAQAGDPLPDPAEVGFRIFSEFDEDGIILFLLGIAGVQGGRFIEFGSGDGVNGSNCANLAINLGFHGLFVDGAKRSIERGRTYYGGHPDTALFPPVFANELLTCENVNQVLKDYGFTGEIDVLSIDIDGNDLWIWEALECVSPRIVVAETHPEFGKRSISVPYQASWSRAESPHPEYFGASPGAMMRLAKRRGYRLVATNRYGFNAFYIRNDIAHGVVEELPLDQVFRHPRNRYRARVFEEIKHLPFVAIDP